MKKYKKRLRNTFPWIAESFIAQAVIVETGTWTLLWVKAAMMVIR